MPLFLWNRVIIALTIIFLKDFLVLQVLIIIILSIFMLIYSFIIQPFNEKLDNYILIFNNLCIVIASLIIGVLAILKDSRSRLLILFGWLFNIILVLNILGNLYKAIRDNYINCKKRIIRKRIGNELKKTMDV